MCNSKRCTNCIHFKTYDGKEPYYCNGVGYCVNYKVDYNKVSHYIKENLGCDKWEAGELQVAAERKYIEVFLIDIQERLAQITQMLKETNR